MTTTTTRGKRGTEIKGTNTTIIMPDGTTEPVQVFVWSEHLAQVVWSSAYGQDDGKRAHWWADCDWAAIDAGEPLVLEATA